MPRTAEQAREFGDRLYFKGLPLLSDSQAADFFDKGLEIPDMARTIPDELWEFLWEQLQKVSYGALLRE